MRLYHAEKIKSIWGLKTMMKFETLLKKLRAAGFEAEPITICNVKVDGISRDVDGIRVLHDYMGPYPTREAMDAHNAVYKLARRAGRIAKQRGFYTATFVYDLPA